MSANRTEKNASLSNQSSDKLLVLLEYLSLQKSPVRLSDLASALDMNASTVLRFLNALQNRGYVTQEASSGRYILTLKLCQLGNNVSSRLNIRQIAASHLQEISSDFRTTANLIVRYNDSCIYLDVVASPEQLSLPLQRIGKVAPLYCTGAGKILLQEFTEQQMQDYALSTPFQAFTQKTITTLEELKKKVDESRINGYAIDDEECEYGTRCIAVPLRDYTGHIIASVSINGSTARFTDAFIKENAPRLRAHAEAISRELGYQ